MITKCIFVRNRRADVILLIKTEVLINGDVCNEKHWNYGESMTINRSKKRKKTRVKCLLSQLFGILKIV